MVGPAPNATPESIDAFVQRVTGWSQLLQRCADGSIARAHDQYIDGEIGYSAYADVVQQKLAVMQSCNDMTSAARGVLLQVAESELGPLQRATDELADALRKLNEIQDGVVVAA